MGEKYTDVGSAKNSQVFSRFSKLLIITNFFQEYYDDMAEDYETVVRAWGYNCPEVEKLYFPRIELFTENGAMQIGAKHKTQSY